MSDYLGQPWLRNLKERKLQLFGEKYSNATLQGNLVFGAGPTSQLEIFVKSPRGFLVVLGPPGTGKTYLCAMLFEWGVRNIGPSVRYFSERSLLTELHRNMDDGRNADVSLEERMDDQFLIYDDMGSGQNTSWIEKINFYLLDSRYNQSNWGTVITSNLSRPEIYERYHERSASRMFDKKNSIVIDLHGEWDYRAESYTA